VKEIIRVSATADQLILKRKYLVIRITYWGGFSIRVQGALRGILDL